MQQKVTLTEKEQATLDALTEETSNPQSRPAQAFQDAAEMDILRGMIHSEPFLKHLIGIGFNPTSLDNEYQKLLGQLTVDLFKQYRKLPTLDQLQVELTAKIKNKKPELIPPYHEVWKAAHTFKFHDQLEWLQDFAARVHNKAEGKRLLSEAMDKAKDKQGNADWHDLAQKLLKLGTSKTGLPEIEDAFDFCERQMQLPTELIEGLLHRGSKLSFGGASKSYKSWALLNQALSIAYGRDWMGCKTNRAKVLVINFELQKEFCQRRLHVLEDARGIEREPGRMDVWNLRGFAAKHEEIFPKIIERIGNNDYGLIVLDPIYKLYGGEADENAAKDMGALLNSIEQVSVQTGAAVAFGAHFSKGNQASKNAIDRVSGSGVFARDPDSIINLTAHEEEDCYTFDAILRNFPPIDPFVVRWSYPVFSKAGELDPAALKTPGRPSKWTPEAALDSLQGKSLSMIDWAKGMGCDVKTLRRLRDVLVQRGSVEDVDQKWKVIS